MTNKPDALFRQIYRTLKTDLDNRVFTHGSMLPSENNLCTRFQTSRQTIRSALKLLEKDDLVSNLPGKGWIVGVFTPKVPIDKNIKPVCFLGRSDSACSSIYENIQQTLARFGLSCQFIPLPTDYMHTWQEAIEPNILDVQQHSAVIIFEDKDIPQSICDLCSGAKIPLLQLAHHKHAAHDTICADFHQGCWDLVHKFYEQGHRSIGFFSNYGLANRAPFKQRYLGYRAAMLELGLTEKKILIDYEYMADPNADQNFMQWLNEGEATTALIDGGGGLMSTLHLTLVRNGKRVPEDISFAFIGLSQDNIDRGVVSKIKPMALVEPWEEMGTTAAHRIHSRIRDNSEPARQILIHMDIRSEVELRTQVETVKAKNS